MNFADYLSTPEEKATYSRLSEQVQASFDAVADCEIRATLDIEPIPTEALKLFKFAQTLFSEYGKDDVNSTIETLCQALIAKYRSTPKSRKKTGPKSWWDGDEGHKRRNEILELYLKRDDGQSDIHFVLSYLKSYPEFSSPSLPEKREGESAERFKNRKTEVENKQIRNVREQLKLVLKEYERLERLSKMDLFKDILG